MKRPNWEEFIGVFDREIRPWTKEIRQDLKKSQNWRRLWNNLVLLSVLAIMFIPSLFYKALGLTAPSNLIFLWLIAFALAAVGLRHAPTFGERTPRRARARIAAAIGAYYGFKYLPQGKALRPQDFEKRGVVPRFTHKFLQNSFEGIVDGLLLMSVEAHLKQKHGLFSLERKTIFRGILVRCKMPQRSLGQILVLKDGGALNRTAQHVVMSFFSDGERVRLEDPKFQEIFEVYATDQVGARVFLSPTKQEAFKRFVSENVLFQAFFEDDEAWIALYYDDIIFPSDRTTFPNHDPTSRENIEHVVRFLSRLWDIPPLLRAR